MPDYSDLPRSVTLPPPPPNPSEVVRMSIEQMRATMTARFGDEPGKWSFICPRCSTVQCADDVEHLGAIAKGNIGKVCVRAYRPTGDPQRCTYTTLTSAGGPMSITQSTIAGDTLRPAMQIAPAPS